MDNQSSPEIYLPELAAALMFIGFMAASFGPEWLGRIAIWLVLLPLLLIAAGLLFAALSGIIGRVLR